jgi:hypothetical protein
MSDLALPEETADLGQAWDELVTLPWIRPRGNGRYVTLHDAVAEAFAQRIFPLHDPEEEWRHRIWQRALEIYSGLADQKQQELQPRLAALDTEIMNASPDHVTEVIGRSLAVNKLRRERDELKAARLYYLFLTNFEQGCELLFTYFAQANLDHDLFFQDLLALYLQRFLPGGTSSGVFDDVIKSKLEEFRRWLTDERPDYYLKIGTMVAAYFIAGARPAAALELLDLLPNDRGPEVA